MDATTTADRITTPLTRHATVAAGLAANLAANLAWCVAIAILVVAPPRALAQQTSATTSSSNVDAPPGADTNDSGSASELRPIVVDAARPEPEKALVERSFDTPDDVAGFGETIFAEPTWRSFHSTAELLGQSVGAQIQRQGGRDDFSTLSIRGAPAAQVRILLDGVALGRASDSVVNLADLPLDTVDRIEVYRGFAPAGLTPTSAAGVVNIVTRDPKQATASVAVGGGSYGTAKVNVGAAQPLLGGSASTFASYRRTDGDFRYVDNGGSQWNFDDDKTLHRANNDSQAVENLLRWRGDVGGSSRVQIRNHIFYKDEGVPGLAHFPLTARLETVRDIAAASLGSANGRWSIEQGATYQSKALRDYAAFDNHSETNATSTTARWGRPVGKANWLSGSADYTWESFDQTNAVATPPTQGATRSALAIAAGDDWTIAALATTLSFQLRQQDNWDRRSASTASGSGSEHSTDPRVGLRWEPAAGFAIKANASSYFRSPNFDEMFGVDGFTVGNPDLKPETGIAHDAGVEWTIERPVFGKLAIGYSYFGSDIDHIIVIQPTFDRMSKARNVSRARIRGHEARLEWHGPAGLAVSSNFTHQNAENRDSATELHGKSLAGLAPNEAWTRLSWTWGSFVFAYDVDVTGAHFYESEHAYPKLPTRVEHGLSMVIGPFWKGMRVTLEADNLGDTLVPDKVDFPLPGRSFYATVSWSADHGEEQANAH